MKYEDFLKVPPEEKQRYYKTLDAIEWLGRIAYKEGWRIPKDRHDLRCFEMVSDKKFWKAIKQFLINSLTYDK